MVVVIYCRVTNHIKILLLETTNTYYLSLWGSGLREWLSGMVLAQGLFMGLQSRCQSESVVIWKLDWGMAHSQALLPHGPLHRATPDMAAGFLQIKRSILPYQIKCSLTKHITMSDTMPREPSFKDVSYSMTGKIWNRLNHTYIQKTNLFCLLKILMNEVRTQVVLEANTQTKRFRRSYIHLHINSSYYVW